MIRWSGMRGARHAALIATLVAMGACGFSTRSDEFACRSGGECDDGRTCVDGWCVFGDVPDPVDADVGPFTCNDFGCTLVCTDDAPCDEPIRCPVGHPCIVQCVGTQSCGDRINCEGTTSCDITCSGPGSCENGVECGGGRCEVECSGADSCAGSVDCEDACACDLTCEGEGSCSGVNDCPFNPCESGNECVVTGGNCDKC